MLKRKNIEKGYKLDPGVNEWGGRAYKQTRSSHEHEHHQHIYILAAQRASNGSFQAHPEPGQKILMVVEWRNNRQAKGSPVNDLSVAPYNSTRPENING